MRRTFRSTLLAAGAAGTLALAGGAWADHHEDASGSSGEKSSSMEDSSPDAASSPSRSEDTLERTQPGTKSDAHAGAESPAGPHGAEPGSAASVERQIQEKLEGHEGLKGIRVEQTVTLEGEVSSAAEREEAARLAREVEGVTRLENRIAVSGGPGTDDVASPPPATGSTSSSTPEASGAASRNEGGLPGESPQEQGERPGSPSQGAPEPSEEEPSGRAPQP